MSESRNRSHAFLTARGAQGLRKMILPVLWALIISAATAPRGRCQICQVPLFIQKGDVDANVMILLDNSGSMNEVITSDQYDPAQDYPGDFENDLTYVVDYAGYYTINDNTAYLVSAPNGQYGRYTGNYLNWIFYVATDEQRDAIPRETKMDVAATVTKAFIDRTEDVHLGLSTFNFDDGATILAECGASPTELKDAIDLMAADSYTPLGESLEDILDYFRRTDSGAPIQYDCQKSFVIVITDGLPTMDRDVSSYLWDADGDGNDPGDCTSLGIPYDNSLDCSDHVDDVAYWARHNDLIDWLGDTGESWEEGQTLVTYTIGFDIDHPLLEETALNGDGIYLSVNDSAELWASLESIMVNIRLRVAAGAAVAVVSSESSDSDYLYRGKFNPSEWMGFVECFELPYKDKEQPYWEAGEILAARDPADRNIYTAVGTSVYSLSDDQADQLMDDMDMTDPVAAAEVIRWTRGEDLPGYRHRKNGWKLGDIIDSAPVAVGSPSFFTRDMDLQDFVNSYATREKMIYVGANDGMLHAFRALDGHELWAFVPEYALPLLKDMADSNYCHKFSVDLTPAVRDVQIAGNWRTILVSGSGAGGAYYFALDITSPTEPDILWQTELPDHLAPGSEVTFAHLDGKDVALIGSGVDRTDGRAVLYILDAANGNLVSSYELSQKSVARNKATAASVVDLDFDGTTDLAYVADLTGTVYRIALNGTANPGSWSVSELFSGSQPITAKPVAAFAEDGNINVYFGTGVYLDEPDILTTDLMSFYCIFDHHDERENPQLVDQSDGDQDVGSADGWYLDLTAKQGERVVKEAAVAAGLVFFTSFAPNSEPCRSGGESFFYRIVYDDGTVPDSDDDWRGQAQTRFRGGGIASKPVLDIVNGTVIVQNSNQTITIEEIGVAYSPLTVKSWQEDFDQVPADSTTQNLE